MIILHNVRYRNSRCRSLYSKNGGQTWWLDPEFRVVANPKYISST